MTARRPTGGRTQPRLVCRTRTSPQGGGLVWRPCPRWSQIVPNVATVLCDLNDLNVPYSNYHTQQCVIVPGVPPKLVATGVAAREIGVARTTLFRWWQDKLVTPALVTAGGHARWDVEDLKRQLRERPVAE